MSLHELKKSTSHVARRLSLFSTYYKEYIEENNFFSPLEWKLSTCTKYNILTCNKDNILTCTKEFILTCTTENILTCTKETVSLLYETISFLYI